MENKMKVLLTDTHWRTAYYVCKSLANKGISVIGLKSVDSIYDRSRYYSKIITVPSLETHPNEWLCRIERIASNSQVFIPVSVNAINLVAKNRERLAKKLLVPYVDVKQIAMATDKLRTIQFMQDIGVPVPVTFAPKYLQEAEEVMKKMSFPLVIKIREEGNISPIRRYGIAENMDQAKNLYNKLSLLQRIPLIQEYVQGEGVGISMLCQKGKPIALFSHQRLREQMINGGPSTFCKPISSQLLEEYAIKFAKTSNWNGIAMLEFKYNYSSNKYYFMEINPRFWGSMELAIKCGVDFPYLFFQWIIGNVDNGTCIRKSNNNKLKYMSMDIRAFSNSIASLDRKSQLKLLISYFSEYFDPTLRLGTIGKDLRVTLHELSSSVREMFRMVKNVI